MIIETQVDRRTPATASLPPRARIIDRWTFVAAPPQRAMVAGGSLPG
jgi:hypothetical protein